jgi:hypothetical protein
MPGYVKPPVNGRVNGTMEMIPSLATQTPLTIKGAVSQTANLLNIQDSSGNVIGSIDSSGRNVTSMQPGVGASRTGSAGAINEDPIKWNNVYSTSGNYNSTTGLFTCPIAGKYYVSSHIITNSPGSGYLRVLKNGSIIAFSHVNLSGTWAHLTTSTLVTCAVNDTLSINSATGFYGQEHNNFSVVYLG